MITHDFKGVKLSGLGLGAMRLPTVEGKENQPDQDKVNEKVCPQQIHISEVLKDFTALLR